MSDERNKTVARFNHDGKSYTIHERQNKLSDGSWCKRRFICDEEGRFKGEASNVREARQVLSNKKFLD